MKCPKCQNEINIYKGVACNSCGYNVLSRPAETENQASSADEHVEKPKQKKVRPSPKNEVFWVGMQNVGYSLETFPDVPDDWSIGRSNSLIF